jgi:chorismate synthase
MSGNTFGKIFRLTSFGESHGGGVGGVIDGCPPGVELSIDKIQYELDRRAPGQSDFSTSRKEGDRLEIVSGLFEGKTTGMPIAFYVHNQDHRTQDYDHLRDVYRPSHADYTWEKKYGLRDYRGGGRSSAREHVARVVAGAIAKQVLAEHDIHFKAYVSQIGSVEVPRLYQYTDLNGIEENTIRCPHRESAEKMMELLRKVREEGDSIGGVVRALIYGLPVGLGEPVFDRFQARLAHAMLSINAAKGFEYGAGFAAAMMLGSEHNDAMRMEEGKIRFKSNHSGGILGGISTGEEICFRVAFKPVATIQKCQQTVNRFGKNVEVEGRGRHDVCVVPRAVPVVEAMAAMVVLDLLLEARCVIDKKR